MARNVGFQELYIKQENMIIRKCELGQHGGQKCSLQRLSMKVESILKKRL